MKNYNIKKILVRLILVLLFMPMLQAKFNIIKIAPLGGYDAKPTALEMTYGSWTTGAYQERKEQFEKVYFGFSNWAIRLNHQWVFSAYGLPSSDKFIIGKENYIFEDIYVNTRNGLDYLGEDSLVHLTQKIKSVQDRLKALDKTLLFVLAPNKADYYPEYLPDHLAQKKKVTNYDIFSQELIKQGINHLDINKWFRSMKDTVSIPIFAKTGTHYTTYGAALTVLKITNMVEQLTEKDLPDIGWEELLWSDIPMDRDDDLEQALNLCFRIKNSPLAYPKMLINKDNKYRPRAIVIGDSFYYELLELGLNYQVFEQGRFWYYNHQIDQTNTMVSNLDLNAELNNTDLLLIIITDANISNSLQYFIDPIYNFYAANGKDLEIKRMTELIYNNPEWLEAIRQKAVVQNISLEQMILIDAKYMIETK